MVIMRNESIENDTKAILEKVANIVSEGRAKSERIKRNDAERNDTRLLANARRYY